MRTERSDITQVLNQMRAMREQMQPSLISREVVGTLRGISGESGSTVKTSTTGSFGEILKGALDGVNQIQAESAALGRSYELGEPGVDLTRVMIASQKASISFQAALQARNKLVTAYQEIMNMPL